MSTAVRTRQDFQRVSTSRIGEAETLLAAGQWDGAFYLGGYSVECALKSCIIKLLMTTDAFPDRKLSDDCYKHDLKLLLKRAGLEDDVKNDEPVWDRWQIVARWSEQSRYEFGREESEVREFLSAINDTPEGVLPWLRQRW